MRRSLPGGALGFAVVAAIAVTAGPPRAHAATITTLDSAGDVGRDSAVAYGPGALALVSYHDATNGDLKVAACQNAACTSASLHTIDDSGTVTGGTSIAIPPDGRALIAYQAGSVVKIARCADAVCSSATSRVVESLTAAHPGTAIAVGGDGLAVVAYGDAGNQRLRIAHCEDPDCSTSTITSVTGTANTGSNVSATTAGDGRVLFAFDSGSHVLVGRCTNAACTSATFTGLFGNPASLIGYTKYYNGSLATAPDGRGAVAATYEQLSIDGAVTFSTHLARCTNVNCSSLSLAGMGSDLFSPSLDVLPGDRPIAAQSDGTLRITVCPPSPSCFPLESFPLEVGTGDYDLAVGPDGVGLVSYNGDDSNLKVAYLHGGPELRAGSATVVEGNSGVTPVAFEVTLSQSASVTVQYATLAGTATPGVDFIEASGTLTFAPGTLKHTVSVGVVGDQVVESQPAESYAVVLSNALGASVVGGAGLGLILEDDVSGSPPAAAELAHGSRHVDDLAALPGPAADVDWYRIVQAPYASYEVVADELSGDVVPLDLQLVASDGSSTVHASVSSGTGPARSLAWQTIADVPVANQIVRVSGGCTSCGPGDRYRLRAYETTLRGARFNNAGSQTTVLLLQNPGTSPVNVTVRFWSTDGALLGTYVPGAPVGPQALLVLPTAQVAGVALQSGSVTVTHDAPYGRLVGKTVSLEPATGLSFDTPLESRRR